MSRSQPAVTHPESNAEAQAWIGRMANELDNLAPVMQAFVGIKSNEGDDSGVYKTSYAVTLGAFRALARRARYDPNMRNLFEQSVVHIYGKVPIETIDVLCSHPVIHSDDYASDDSHQLESRERGRWLREFLGIGIKKMLGNLFKMSLMVGARRAASLLHKYILQRKSNQLSAYNIRLIYGLELHRCIELKDGLFLMPYAFASEIYDLPVDPEQAFPIPRTSESRGSERKTGVESVAALVREATWGMSRELKTWDDDYDVLFALASIALGCPIEVRSNFVIYPRWMENIGMDRSGGGIGTIGEGQNPYVENQKLAGDSLARFVDMYRGFVSFRGDRQKIGLIVGRMAQAYSRRGGYWLEDSILDTSIALEMMYQIDNPESTYKLATRAAALLESEPDRRMDTFLLIRDFYGLRSRIAHGRYRPAQSQHQADTDEGLRRDGLELAVHTLMRLLEEGTPENWNSLVVAGIHR